MPSLRIELFLIFIKSSSFLFLKFLVSSIFCNIFLCFNETILSISSQTSFVVCSLETPRFCLVSNGLTQLPNGSTTIFVTTSPPTGKQKSACAKFANIRRACRFIFLLTTSPCLWIVVIQPIATSYIFH